MPGFTMIVAPGGAASIAAWSESPGWTTIFAAAFAAGTGAPASSNARVVINSDRGTVRSFTMDCVPSCPSTLVGRKGLDPGDERARRAARDMAPDIPQPGRGRAKTWRRPQAHAEARAVRLTSLAMVARMRRGENA